MCAHSSDGAMGIVVNHTAANLAFPDLLVQLDIIPESQKITLPERISDVRVLRGGPVETGRGFVLHSSDFFIENSTLPIDEGICLTATLDILKAIALGDGPSNAILALGYAGWGSGSARKRDPVERLAPLSRRCGPHLRVRRRDQIRAGHAQDRHRSRHAVERCRPRLISGVRPPEGSASAASSRGADRTSGRRHLRRDRDDSPCSQGSVPTRTPRRAAPRSRPA